MGTNQAKKRRCAEIMETLVAGLCSFDRLRKVGNDMKQFILGTRILSNLLLSDIWNLYASRSSTMSLKHFSCIASCYYQSLIQALPTWVENSAAFVLEMMNLNIPLAKLDDLLQRSKPKLQAETKMLCIEILDTMDEHILRAWNGISKGQNMIDWHMFSAKFLSSMENSWGKKGFWRKLCLILYQQMSKTFPGLGNLLLSNSMHSVRGGGFRTPELFRSARSPLLQTPEILRSPGGLDTPVQTTEHQIRCGKEDA